MRRKLTWALLVAFVLFACGKDPETPVTPDPVAPAAPAGLKLHGSTETSLTFQWDAVDGALAYEWTLTGEGVSQEGRETKRNASVSGLKKATAYRFGVRSVNSDKQTSAYTYLDATTAGTADPVNPTPGPTVAYEDFKIPADEEDGVARAFPGAEGGGMYTTGGRGGKVIHVTNLNDKGSGSLRAALEEKGARTIVFDVAGVIPLESTLVVRNGDVTLAGQTAPGEGICLKNYTLRINASNVIVRYIRCRMGDEKKTVDDAMNIYTGDNDIHDVIIDHCSLSWSTDECGSFYGMTNFTLGWSILSESLRNSVHGDGKHGYGGIWGGTNATYHHNLLAHHDSRNPRLDHDYVSTLKGPVSLINNVIYNWGDNSTYGGESANDNNEFRRYNLINNYYKPGPATGAGKVRFIDPWTKACENCTKKTGSSTIVPGHFFLDGNVMDFSSDAAGDMSSDNWKGTTASVSVINTIRSTSRFGYPDLETSLWLHGAYDAYEQVLKYAGASLDRDRVDERVTKEVRNRNATYTGSNSSTGGLIDSQTDVGGWPAYEASARELAAVKDSDGDGIPDAVEDAWGMDKGSAADGAACTIDPKGRYTNLEMYLHYLVRDIVAGGNEKGSYVKL